MAAKTQRIEVMLETLLESVDLAESISMRVAEAAGFPEEEVHKIGMAVREGVINAYNYASQHDRPRPRPGQRIRADRDPGPAGRRKPAAHLRPRPVFDACIYGRVQSGAWPRRRSRASNGKEAATNSFWQRQAPTGVESAHEVSSGSSRHAPPARRRSHR